MILINKKHIEKVDNYSFSWALPQRFRESRKNKKGNVSLVWGCREWGRALKVRQKIEASPSTVSKAIKLGSFSLLVSVGHLFYNS